MTRLNRFLSLILGFACLATAWALHHKPVAAIRQVSSPSANILITDPLPDADDELLSRSVSQIDFTDAPLETVVKKLAEMEGANTSIDPDLLATQLPRPLSVTIHLKDVTLEKALQAIMREANAHHQDTRAVDFDVVDGSILIGFPEAIPRRTRIELFNIRAIVNGLGTDARGLSAAQLEKWESRNEDDAGQIVTLITNYVDSTSWLDQGGTTGSIRELGGVLVVMQMPRNIAYVSRVLDALARAAQAEDFSPAMLDPAVGNARLAKGLCTAFFNIHNLLPRSESPRLKNSSTDRIRQSIVLRVPHFEWDARDGSGIDQLGDILAVTQTPETINAVQRVLGELSRELP